MTPTPVEVLRRGTESLGGGLQPSGELHDPVFACPTQYGGAYYAWCCSVLAGLEITDTSVWRDRSRRALAAAVAHTTDPDAEPYASGFDPHTGSVVSRLNHRDFTWPPILRTLLADPDPDHGLLSSVASADIDRLFRARPPSNWAAVWMTGEWLRRSAGLCATTVDQFDQWLEVFFRRPDGTGFEVDLGLYVERGIPNAYDLFTRVHLGELLVAGYDGRHRDRLLAFLSRGLRRSLAFQLSDGSLASGYRSAGQTWVLGAQIALFHTSVALGLGTSDDHHDARAAAWRAFSSLARWQRPEQPFSPVQNLLDPTLRIGYESYTADGHYSPLALAFLATAVAAGFGDSAADRPGDLDARPARTYTEAEPTHRGAAQRGRISVAVQTRADGVYDATGTADLTFGTGRLLHLVSSARSTEGGDWLVPGLATRARAGSSPVHPVCSRPHAGAPRLQAGPGPSLSFTSRLPHPGAEGTEPDSDCPYDYLVTLLDDGIDVVESTPGCVQHRTLLVPYPRDVGGDDLTRTMIIDQGVRLVLGEEWLEIAVHEPVERIVDLVSGYTSRRGLCGLVRIDLRDPGDQLRWSVRSSP